MIKSGLRESSKWQPLFYGKMVWNYAIWDDWFQENWHKAGRLGDLKLKLIFNFSLDLRWVELHFLCDKAPKLTLMEEGGMNGVHFLQALHRLNFIKPPLSFSLWARALAVPLSTLPNNTK
jgi:hypothetical protein